MRKVRLVDQTTQTEEAAENLKTMADGRRTAPVLFEVGEKKQNGPTGQLFHPEQYSNEKYKF